MHRLLTIGLWIAILFGLAAFDRASACSCGRISRDQAIDLAQNVFEGRAISVRPMTEDDHVPKSDYIGNRDNGLVTRFQVIKSIKGNLSGEVEILTGRTDGMCGQDYTAAVGSEVTVGTSPASLPDQVTGLCMHLALNPPDLILQRRFKTSAPISYSEIRIIDGDTIRLRDMRANTRLVGFNAPETENAQCEAERQLGSKARRRLRQLGRDGNLEFEFVACSCPAGTEGRENCNFGRSCGTLKSNGRDVGTILIEENLAVPFRCEKTSCPRIPRAWCE